MPFVFDISVLLGGLTTILLSLIAFFIKQLHNDFKRVERGLGEVKITTQIIKSEFRSDFQVLSQRVQFMETRIKNLEKFKS